ncbi:DNA-binding transcriptional regulator, AcrR family [Parafrankia irregularis]|uniref:DNA-binding transcriptional regulator, AcrR family n=1 Tax=Parafrankia irregularis TaxID=795642 RepID=A0A0S4QUT6_9ACTN|nr:DNA-binding transcriptional regulator, AcrR family [Parafrankia irregularis]
MFANTVLCQDPCSWKLTPIAFWPQHGTVTRPVPRRERLRQTTIEEIKKAAHKQLTERGAAGLSLRAVAREMGMTPSAIYRYFDSRAALIHVLAQDAYSSLADVLEAAFDAAPTDDHLVRWLLVARSHRRWAMLNPTEYTLIFGPQPDDLTDPSTAVLDELERSVAVLLRCMAEAIEAGVFDPSGLEAELSPNLRRQFEAWDCDDSGLGPVAEAACMLVWTQLHGLLALDLFGHLPEPLRGSGELFDQQMIGALVRVGGQAPVDFAEVIDRADRWRPASVRAHPNPAPARHRPTSGLRRPAPVERLPEFSRPPDHTARTSGTNGTRGIRPGGVTTARSDLLTPRQADVRILLLRVSRAARRALLISPSRAW